jgi:hypothetical protein
MHLQFFNARAKKNEKKSYLGVDWLYIVGYYFTDTMDGL